MYSNMELRYCDDCEEVLDSVDMEMAYRDGQFLCPACRMLDGYEIEVDFIAEDDEDN